LREKLLGTLSQLQADIQKGEFATYAAVPVDHVIRTTVKTLVEELSKLPQREEASVMCASKAVLMLYNNSESPIARDVFVSLLTRLCEISPKTMKELNIWLLYGEDEVFAKATTLNAQQKYNVPVTISLIQAGILNTSELDDRLAKSMREGNKLATLFTANLIREAVLSPSPAAERGDFQSCLHAIDSMIRELAPLVPKTVRKLWRDLREDKYTTDDTEGEDDTEINEVYVKVFAEWVALVSQPTTRRAHVLAFIQQMHSQGILGDDVISTTFYRVNLQMSIGSFFKFAPTTQTTEVYRVIDAFALLLVSVVQYNGDAPGARILYLTKLLSLIVLVFMDMHEELVEQFQQKPFFRLFSMMLTYLLRDNEAFEPIEYEILAVFGEALSVLQPTYFPNFTFAWWALVSHQHFMPRLLLLPDKKVFRSGLG
jgi:CCR4-NOT transcription complex subunit 1